MQIRTADVPPPTGHGSPGHVRCLPSDPNGLGVWRLDVWDVDVERGGVPRPEERRCEEARLRVVPALAGSG